MIKIKNSLIFLVFLPLLSSNSISEYQIRPPVDTNPYKRLQNEKPSCLPPEREIPKRYRELFNAASKEYGIPLEILAAIADVESGFRAYAASRVFEDGHRDLGMFQFHNDYLDWLADSYNAGLPFDPFSAEQAIRIASRHIKWLYERYGHWPDVVMAYNAGITRIDSGNIPDRTWKYLTAVYFSDTSVLPKPPSSGREKW